MKLTLGLSKGSYGSGLPNIRYPFRGVLYEMKIIVYWERLEPPCEPGFLKENVLEGFEVFRTFSDQGVRGMCLGLLLL